MSTTIQTWYDFVLQQMAAESYLDGWNSLSLEDKIIRLNLGSNNFSIPTNLSTEPLLPGATRMTATQAADFLTRYTIVSHLPNTASGFSATLMRDNATGAYTLSMRSTEYFNASQGGDWSRDGLSGADGEISGQGFAFGQLLSMEQYWNEVVKGIVGASKINVTGYSLSGNLASVFTELHPEAVASTTTFNAAGIGHIQFGDSPGMTQPAIIQEMLTKFHAKLLALNPGWDAYAADTNQNIYNNADYLAVRAEIISEYNPIFSSAEISNNLITQLFGHGAHNDTEIVANSGTHVPATPIFIEDQPNIQGEGPFTWFDLLLGTQSDYGTTHSITLIADQPGGDERIRKARPGHEHDGGPDRRLQPPGGWFQPTGYGTHWEQRNSRKRFAGKIRRSPRQTPAGGSAIRHDSGRH